jgi:hypothetical protein
MVLIIRLLSTKSVYYFIDIVPQKFIIKTTNYSTIAIIIVYKNIAVYPKR